MQTARATINTLNYARLNDFDLLWELAETCNHDPELYDQPEPDDEDFDVDNWEDF